MQLAKLKTLETPALRLEQYPVSPEAAAELLYMAGFEHDDLKGHVIDLGTGTGRLAIGAALMGSEQVAGVDVDPRALALARKNAETSGVDVEWIESDIDEVRGSYDALIMNPPYGTRTSHADTKFLDKAFQLAPVTYSFHKSSTMEYLVKHVRGANRRIDEARRLEMKIPYLFKFHTRKWSSVEVDICRILR